MFKKYLKMHFLAVLKQYTLVLYKKMIQHKVFISNDISLLALLF